MQKTFKDGNIVVFSRNSILDSIRLHKYFWPHCAKLPQPTTHYGYKKDFDLCALTFWAKYSSLEGLVCKLMAWK